MKRICFVFVCLFVAHVAFGDNDMHSLLHELDKTIDNHEVYDKIKEGKLTHLKELLKITPSDGLRYTICGQLFDEYKAYTSDSALSYARIKLQIAEKLHDKNKLNDARLNLASIMATVGMYNEALDIIGSVDINFSPDLKAYYF